MSSYHAMARKMNKTSTFSPALIIVDCYGDGKDGIRFIGCETVYRVKDKNGHRLFEIYRTKELSEDEDLAELDRKRSA